jgi:serine/threonine protein kinase/WD40 repeat protein
MPELAACPAPTRYRPLLLGLLAEEEARPLEEHLAGCPSCLEAARLALGDDPLLDALRSPPALDEAGARTVEGLVRRLETLRAATGDTPPTEPGPAQEDGYPFLAPAEAPGELGRLGPYRVLEVLGQGGMGVVFRALDPALERQVALKVLPPGLAGSAPARERFLREARAAARVRHDHVVTIYHVGEDRGTPYLAMELLAGESLETALHRGPMSLAEVLRIGREAALGLAAAHEQGLVHRDVKPANLWLEAPAGRVKVLDFGLVRAGSDGRELTREGAVVGTPAYMSPEQARGRPVDARSDLFSLGCVLYRLAAGRPPFGGDDVVSTLLAVALDEPDPPGRVCPGLPPALAGLILQLLAKSPAGRPASAREVARRLAEIEAGPPPRRRSRRRWLVAAGLALAAALAVIVRVETGDGTLELQTQADDVQVVVKHGGRQVTVLDPRTGSEFRLRPGRYTFELSEEKAGLAISARELELSRGGRKLLRVTYRASAAATKARPRAPAPRRESALDRLDPVKIPAEERLSWQPKELVAVLGEHRLRQWGTPCAAFSRDGKRLLTWGGEDRFCRVWDVATQRLLHEVECGAGAQVSLSPDAQTLAAGRPGERVRLWAVSGSAAAERTVDAKMVGGRIALGPGGLLALADAGRPSSVALWDLSGKTPVRKAVLHVKPADVPIRHLVFSLDGKTLAANYSPHVAVWDLSGAAPRERVVLRDVGITVGVPGESDEGGVRLPGAEDLPGNVNSGPLTLSANGERIALIGKGKAEVWDVKSSPGRLRATLRAGELVLLSGAGLALAPDGKSLAVCWSSWVSNSCELWDVSGEKPLLRKTLPRVWAETVAWSADGQTLAVGEFGGAVRLWDLSGAEPFEAKPPRGHASGLGMWMAFSPDGNRLASASTFESTHLWKLSGDRPEQVATLPRRPGSTWLKFTAGGKRLLASEDHIEVQLWDVSARRHRHVRTLSIPGAQMWWDNVSSEELLLVSIGGPGAPLCGYSFEGGSPRERWELPRTEFPWPVAVTRDGKRLAARIAQFGRRVQLWDLTGSKPRKTEQLHPPEGRSLSPLAFSADGRLLAVATHNPAGAEVVQLWEVAGTPRVKHEVEYAARKVLFSPDGQRFACLRRDQEVTVWAVHPVVEAKKPLYRWRFPGPVSHLAWAPDGRHLATANGNGTIYVLRLAPAR